MKWTNDFGTVLYGYRLGIFGNVLSSETRRLVVRNDTWQLAPLYVSRVDIGSTPLSLVSDNSRLSIRNDASQLAPLLVSRLDISGNELRFNSENNSFYALQRPNNTLPVFLMLPRTLGLANNQQFLSVNDNGETSFTTPESENVRSFTVNFNSSATVNLFQLPSNAYITSIQIIIDTTFNTAATLSVGHAGNLSSLLATSDSLLTLPIGTVFDHDIISTPQGTPRELQAGYTRNSAASGSARILIFYRMV